VTSVAVDHHIATWPMNMLQKPFDNPKVREAINYAINKEALVKVAFGGYAIPAEGVVPHGVNTPRSWAHGLRPEAKARELLKEAGYPNGFESHPVVGLQLHHQRRR
jgi:glutathione transport system substrate-binding protein